MDAVVPHARPVPQYYWYFGDPHLLDAVQQWYAMPHRRNSLFAVAQFLFLNDQALRERMRPTIANWRRRLDTSRLPPAEEAALQQCVKAFDIDRWEVGPPLAVHQPWCALRQLHRLRPDALK